MSPERTRRGVGANRGEQIGDLFWIARSAKESLHARGGEGREKILKVHAQNYGLTRVGSRERGDGALFAEAMNCFVRRDVVEEIVEDAALQLLQARLGGFDQANCRLRPCASGLREDAIMIVEEWRDAACAFAVEVPAVGKPFQFWRREVEPLGKGGHGRDRRERPVARERDRLHVLRLGGPLGEIQG